MPVEKHEGRAIVSALVNDGNLIVAVWGDCNVPPCSGYATVSGQTTLSMLSHLAMAFIQLNDLARSMIMTATTEWINEKREGWEHGPNAVYAALHAAMKEEIINLRKACADPEVTTTIVEERKP